MRIPKEAMGVALGAALLASCGTNKNIPRNISTPQASATERPSLRPGPQAFLRLVDTYMCSPFIAQNPDLKRNIDSLRKGVPNSFSESHLQSLDAYSIADMRGDSYMGVAEDRSLADLTRYVNFYINDKGDVIGKNTDNAFGITVTPQMSRQVIHEAFCENGKPLKWDSKDALFPGPGVHERALLPNGGAITVVGGPGGQINALITEP